MYISEGKTSRPTVPMAHSVERKWKQVINATASAISVSLPEDAANGLATLLKEMYPVWSGQNIVFVVFIKGRGFKPSGTVAFWI